MSTVQKSLLWAAAILGATFVSVSNGMSDGAVFGVIAGLSGAAVSSIYRGKRSCGACL